MAETVYASFDDLIQITPQPLQPIARRLREIILEIYPEACEVVRLGDRAATYGTGPRKMIEGFAYIMPQKSWINLGFYKGSQLPDPEGILEGTGQKLRHIKIRSVEEAGKPAFRAMIQAAVAERKKARGE